MVTEFLKPDMVPVLAIFFDVLVRSKGSGFLRSQAASCLWWWSNCWIWERSGGGVRPRN